MNARIRTALLILGISGFSGCAVHEVHKDHDLIRTTLLDLYTNQVMDNLVRAAEGLPIIQLDYTQAQGQVTIKNTVGGSDNQQATVSNVLALPAATLMATRGIVTTLMGNLGNENTNQVSLAATPVTTSNEVYDAYLEYLSVPGSLRVTCDRPPDGTYHRCEKRDGMYYWVPIAFKPLFFRLSLLTTARRGKALLPTDEFYQVTLKQIVGEEPAGLHPDSGVLITYKLDKKIPNDGGYLVFDNKPKEGAPKDAPPTVEYSLSPMQGAPNSEFDTLRITASRTELPILRQMPLTAKVYLQHKRPAPPTTDDLINRVNFQLQQIQFNQLRQSGL